MSILFIPFFGALGAGAAVLLGAHLFFSQGLERIRAIIRERRYFAWLQKMPISPFTRMATKSNRLESLARRAGLESTFARERVLRYKEASLWASVIIVLFLYFTAPLDQVILVGLVLFGLSARWPELFLLRRAVKLQRELERDLTHVIDLIRLYVSAGKNLEEAMRSVSAVTGGAWGRVLGRVIYRLDAGFPFDEALEAAALGLEVPDFNRFVLALKQSRLLGASLGGTLSVQSLLLRARRKQRADEQARVAAVKIALPLVLCIFPALLIIYLAPAVLRILDSL